MQLDVLAEHGLCRWHIAAADQPRALLALGTGSNGNVESEEFVALAEVLPAQGFTVARLEPEWTIAHRQSAPGKQTRIQEWETALNVLIQHYPGVPLFTGGRSAGASVACASATDSLLGVVALAYPLHAPGKELAEIAPDLLNVEVPVLLVSGDRDPFGSPEDFQRVLAAQHNGPRNSTIIEGAAHRFPVQTGPVVVEAVLRFLNGYTACD